MPTEVPLRTVFDRIPVMMVTYDAHRRLIGANQETLRTLGWPEQIEISSVDLLAECYPDLTQRQDVVEHIWTADGIWRDFKTQARHGAVLDISWTGMSLEDGSRFGIGRNVTVQKQTEETLRENEEQFRLMFEMAPIGLVMCELDGRLLHVNDAFSRILGRSVENLLSANWRQLIHPEDLDSYHSELGRIVSGVSIGFSKRWRYVRSGANRGIVVGSTQATLVRDEAGRPLFLVILVDDITERVQAEGDRDVLIRQLESKNADLESYTHTISQDLKNPLITIRELLRPLRQNIAEGKSDQIQSDLDRISGIAGRVEQQLGELAELAQIGRVINAYESVSLMSLAQEAVDLVFQPVDRPTIYVQISAKLPTVRVDRLRILQVYRCLLENSIKFMRDSSELWIHIGIRTDDGEKIFYVRDSGIGIDPRHLPKVFELFHQADPSYGGTGVGLTLAKRIIDAHGGRIWAESEGLDQGATICFTLPQITDF